jgi:hypothetical protein
MDYVLSVDSAAVTVYINRFEKKIEENLGILQYIERFGEQGSD